MVDVYHYDDSTFFGYTSVSSISQLSRLFMKREDMMMLLHDFPFFSACLFLLRHIVSCSLPLQYDLCFLSYFYDETEKTLTQESKNDTRILWWRWLWEFHCLCGAL